MNIHHQSGTYRTIVSILKSGNILYHIYHHCVWFGIKEGGRIKVLKSHMIDETITPQIQQQQQKKKIKFRSSPYLASFDAVEQYWVRIPFQSHRTDYTLKDKTQVEVRCN